MASAVSSPRLAAPWRLLLVAALVLCAARPAAAEIGVLSDIRFWSAGDVTRVALETTVEARYRYDRLQDPDRVYVDLIDIRPKPGQVGMQTIPVGDGLIKQIRYALTQRNVTRVVLDLEASVELHASQLSNPDRVMLEIRLVSPPSGSHEPAAETPLPPVAEPPQPVPPPAARIAPRPFVPPPFTPSQPLPPLLLASLGAPPRLPATPVARLRLPATGIGLPSRPPPPPSVGPAPVQPAPEPRQQADATETRVASPAQRDRTGNRSLTRVLGLKLGRVLLDPGHGGHDTGTISRNGLVEKELVLDVALRLGKLIEERLNAEVIFTRTDDRFIPLEKRTAMANEMKADLFLSIHANASPLRATSGPESFYLNFTTSRADLEVAARENAGSEKSIHELSDLIRKIALRDKIEESREFAARIQSAAHELSSQVNGHTRNRGVKKAPFVVLIGAEMPSVLTEIGFMTNPREETLLKRSDYRQKIAEALYKGISQYSQTLSHFRVAQR